jgi:hypothetical protein
MSGRTSLGKYFRNAYFEIGCRGSVGELKNEHI